MLWHVFLNDFLEFAVVWIQIVDSTLKLLRELMESGHEIVE